MKILFIENRYKTYFYAPIAKKLKEEGYEVHWLVQNKEFTPSSEFDYYRINYPSKRFTRNKKDPGVEQVIESDRQINHFGINDTSYFYYYNEKIEEYLVRLKPDFVFGESTSFHELLTISNCRKHNFLYLNPSTSRYPIGRFAFYLYDTLEPYKGSGEVLSDDEAKTVVDQIVQRKSKPDYMRLKSPSMANKILDKTKKVVSFINGEKYNTPNPLVKYKIEKGKKAQIQEWDSIAEEKIDNNKNVKILYPLQMQPEANIDVWGRKYRNQTKLIKTISMSLPKDTLLYVKPNPKSKYELSAELIDLVRSDKNIVPLAHNVKMDTVLPVMDMVITVTGTIAIECILSNKPVATLIKTINNESPNCIYLKTLPNKLQNIVHSIKEGSFVQINESEKIKFVNRLNATSYQGIVSDPFTDRNCLKQSNIDAISKAFLEILKDKKN